MSSINVHYFALLREKAGVDIENMVFEDMSYGDLYRRLAVKYNFGLPPEMIQVAVNDEFCSMQEKISVGAKIVFIPPVAGG